MPTTLLTYSAALALFLILYLIYLIFVKPLTGMNFYKNQGIKMTFFPLLGNVKSCLEALATTNDFYGHWKNQIKKNPNTKAIGGNSLDCPHLYLLDPQLIREFYHNQENYIKAPMIVDLFKLFNRAGLIVSEGETWKRHRKIISSAFHYELLRDMVPDIVKIIGESLEDFKKKDLNNFSLNQELEVITAEVIGRLFFGQDFHGYRIQGEPVVKFASKLVTKVGSEASSLLYLIFGVKLFEWGLLPKYRKMRKDIQEYHDFADSIIEKKKRELKSNTELDYPPSTSKTLIDILLRQEDVNTEQRFTIQEISNEFMTFLGAGTSTTAATPTRAIYYLHENPQYKAKLMEEIDKYFGDSSTVTIETLNQMDFMTAFIKETLRFAPPLLGLLDRLATKDHNLGDLKIQKGTLVNVGGLVNNFNPDYYDNEDAFDPERWLIAAKTKESAMNDPFVFIPFSAGPRNCIGQHLAMIEIKIILSFLLKKYEFVLDPDYKHAMIQRIVYEPLNPVKFKLICKEA